MLTHASTDESNKAFIKLLIDKDPLKSVKSQMSDLQLKSSIVHPVAYISGSFTESQCRWSAITKECLAFYVNQKVFLLFIKLRLICSFGP